MSARRPSDAAGGARSAGVVVPVRSFAFGKARLASVLGDDARRDLVQTMAERVVTASGGRPLVVVSSAPEVAAWARALGLDLLPDPGGLDAAADAGREWVRARGLARTVVMHADLPLATTLAGIADDADAPVAVLVPDVHDDGTPVLAIPSAADFAFSYGPGSCARHVAEARRAGLDVRIERDRALGFDVDVEADLEALARASGPRP